MPFRVDDDVIKLNLFFYENLFLLLKKDSVMQWASFHLSDCMLRVSNPVNRSGKLVGFLTVHQLDSAELHRN